MQPQGSAETNSPPPGGSGSGGGSGKGLLTALAATAIVLSLIAVGVSFVVPGPKGSTGATGPQGAQGAQGSQGPAGPAGPKGAQGTNGTNGTNGTDQGPYTVYWAVINNTTLVRGSGVNATETFMITTGIFQVDFDSNITGCSYFGTIGFGNSTGSAPPGFVGVTGRFGTPDGLWVTVYNVTGVLTNLPFHIEVVCGGGLWALINATTGSAVRSSGVNTTSTFIEGTGEYQVVFDQSVTTCAYVATPGLNGSTGSTPPYFVTVVGRFGNPNGLWVTTYDTAGAPTDESFFIQVIC